MANGKGGAQGRPGGRAIGNGDAKNGRQECLPHGSGNSATRGMADREEWQTRMSAPRVRNHGDARNGKQECLPHVSGITATRGMANRNVCPTGPESRRREEWQTGMSAPRLGMHSHTGERAENGGRASNGRQECLPHGSECTATRERGPRTAAAHRMADRNVCPTGPGTRPREEWQTGKNGRQECLPHGSGNTATRRMADRNVCPTGPGIRPHDSATAPTRRGAEKIVGPTNSAELGAAHPVLAAAAGRK
jgi:hypothetical protein